MLKFTIEINDNLEKQLSKEADNTNIALDDLIKTKIQQLLLPLQPQANVSGVGPAVSVEIKDHVNFTGSSLKS